MIPNLQDLLQYKNTKLIERYESEFPNAILSGDDALTELMKYIWLCYQHDYDKSQSPTRQAYNFQCTIHEEMSDIDNMWHTFLLFTKDYQSFCNTYLNGAFFHHDPIQQDVKKVSKRKYEKELKKYLSYIYDKLGEQTLITWFGSAI